MAFRRGTNVSQFNANLNLINPMYGTAAEPTEDAFDQSNLDLFSNADFFDWDMGQSIQSTIGSEPERGDEKKVETTALDVFGGETGLEGFDLNSVDFTSLQSYLMNDFTQPQQPHLQPAATTSRPQQPQPRPRNLNILPQPAHVNTGIPSALSSSSTFASPISPDHSITASNSLKRKSVALDAGSPQQNLEEASRAAAEEDKRRRNTAASARFRVKKKQREQALEQHSKELETKLQELNGKVSTLENENKWLKDLLMEKHGSNEDFIKLIKSAPFPLSSLSKNVEASDD